MSTNPNQTHKNCEFCTMAVEDCTCPACPVCGKKGNKQCYTEHFTVDDCVKTYSFNGWGFPRFVVALENREKYLLSTIANREISLEGYRIEVEQLRQQNSKLTQLVNGCRDDNDAALLAEIERLRTLLIAQGLDPGNSLVKDTTHQHDRNMELETENAQLHQTIQAVKFEREEFLDACRSALDLIQILGEIVEPTRPANTIPVRESQTVQKLKTVLGL